MPHRPGVTLGPFRDARAAQVESGSGFRTWPDAPQEWVRVARVKALAKFYAKNERKGVGL